MPGLGGSQGGTTAPTLQPPDLSVPPPPGTTTITKVQPPLHN